MAARYRPGDATTVVGATKLALRELALRVRHLEDQVDRLDANLAPLVTSTCPQLVARFGVGPQTAAALLVAAGDNPDRLRHDAAFAALCGASPRGPSASWPCPDPGHGPQTGRTPPVTIFQTRDGTERWRCHSCGAGGTAFDLVMRSDGVGFRDALDRLGRRIGAPEAATARVVPLRTTTRPTPPVRSASPALEEYVRACEAWLWGPGGRVFRRFLASRGLGEEVLRANRVGADPGARTLPRADGLPRRGPAVVLPLLDEQNRVAYLQARYLQPRHHKYDNPAASLVPVSPRFGEMRLAGVPVRDDVVLVCEGIPDALSAAQAGWRSVAVLGAGLPDGRVAVAIRERFADETCVIAFDADHRGQAGARELERLLARREGVGAVVVLDVPEQAGDLNAWRISSGDRFEAELDKAVGGAIDQAHNVRPGVDLDDLLETLAYRHLLTADQTDMRRTVEEITAAIGSWITGEAPEAGPPGTAAEILDQITYHHVLPGTPGNAVRVADRAADVLGPWLDKSGGMEPPGVSLGW